MKYVIIGNGIAGVTAVKVLSREKESQSTITQFSDQPIRGYYNRPKIPTFIGNHEMTVDDVIVYGLDWYRKRDVDLRIKEKVERIDFDTKDIETQKGSYPFDRLLIATGADCWSPPIQGQDLQHFYLIRNLVDAIEIRKKIETSKKAVIIGGGVLGLEIADTTIKQGLITDVIEFLPQLLPRQLDEEGSFILQKILEDRGINIYLGKEVKEVVGKRKVEQIITKDGMAIPADLVMTCTGIQPRINLAMEFLKVNRGIVVKDYLETSMNDIYAAGDCAEYQGVIYGLIPPSIQQAGIAASNMVNPQSTRYSGSKVSATLKVTDLLLSSFGYTGKETQLGYQTLKYVNNNKYVKLFVHNDKIKAAMILGVRAVLPIIRKIFTQEKSFKENEDKIRKIIPDLE
jgi:nitrite reductase (NADH) large subunit